MKNLWVTVTGWFGKRGSNASKPSTDHGGLLETEPVPRQLSKIRKRGDAKTPAELREAIYGECFDLGYDTARKSRLPRVVEAMLKALEGAAHAIAAGFSVALSEFTQQNLARRLKAREDSREQRTLERDRAANKLDAARQNLASIEAPGAYPIISPLLAVTATLWLAVSLAPSFHDMFVGLDAFMMWFAGGFIGMGVAVAVLLGMLPSRSPETQGKGNKAIHDRAVAAGVMLGVAFFIFRLASARTFQDMLLAAALALMELGDVLLLERKSKALFARIETWRERTGIWTTASAQVEAAQHELDRRQALVDEDTAAIAKLDAAFESFFAAADAKGLSNIGVSAVRAGYMKGIAENAAELGGAA